MYSAGYVVSGETHLLLQTLGASVIVKQFVANFSYRAEKCPIKILILLRSIPVRIPVRNAERVYWF